MKRHTGFITIVMVSILIMTAFINVFFTIPDTEAGTVNTFSDGSSELIVDFPGSDSKYIKVPADANVTKCTLNFTTLADDSGKYPENIELKFGEALPIDWAYQGTWHGGYGQQLYFKDSQVRVNLSYDGDKYNDTLSFVLPKDADVSSASVKMSAYEYDFWESGIKELNIPDDRTWNQDPYPFVFQNRLWCFYRDYNSTQTSESDGDLSYNWTTDGKNWASGAEITLAPDTIVPYPGQGPTHICGDFHPFVVQFDDGGGNDMGVFWGSMSFYNLPVANPWPGITNGTDRDIVCRWYDPINGWGDYIEITHPTENANESHYTKNPETEDETAIRPWSKTDQRPNAVEFKDKIYAIWMTNNTGNTTFHMHDYSLNEDGEVEPWWHWNHRGDIIISNSSDGESWSKGVDLTAGDRWWDIDFAPTLCVYKDKLYAMWETNAPRYVNVSGNWTKRVDVTTKYDWDIVYRYTSDGVNWSDFIEMTPKGDTPVGTTGPENAIPDEDPRLAVYTDPVTSEERMYCIWRTRNPKITNGTDYDIVVRYTTDGINWTEPVEMTDKKTNGGYDNKPELTVFNNKLYVVWRREQGERWADNPDGDIVTRHWDGKEWSVLQEVSPFDGDGTGRNDFYANSIGFNDGTTNKLYTFWVTRNRGEGWTKGTDADVVVRSMVPSDLPFKAGLDIGNDGTWELGTQTQFSDAQQSRKLDIKTAVTNLLADSTYVANNLLYDDFGNEFVEFKMNVFIDEPGRIRFDDLNIYYNVTLTVGDGITYSPEVEKNPFADKINKYIVANQEDVDNEGMITIKLDVTSPSMGRIKMHNMFLEYNRKPTFTLTAPLDTQLVLEEKTKEIKISWEDFDIDDNANIALYYHQNKYQSYKGTLITDNIKEDDETDSFIWTVDDTIIKSDTYYSVFGVITDGVNVIRSYAPGNIFISWTPPPIPYIVITEPNGKNDMFYEEFKIEWDDSGEDSLTDNGAKITLYYTPEKILNITGNVNATQIDINEDGEIDDQDFVWENDDGRKGEYLWNIEHLDEGSSYYITAIIDDGINPPQFDCSEYKMYRTWIPPPEPEVDDGTEDWPGRWSTHSIRPRISWTTLPGSYLFFITVWKGTDNTGLKIFEAKNITEYNIDIDPVDYDMKYDEIYYVELYSTTYQGAISTVVGFELNIYNTPPDKAIVQITPDKPTSSSTLVCLEPPRKFDSDGDLITYSYRWKKNGDYVEKFDNIRTIPTEETKKGDEWTVEITADDGIDLTKPMNSTTITILNSMPKVEIKSPTSGGEYNSDIPVNIHGEAMDTDDDTLTVEWYFDLPDPDNATPIISGLELPDKTGGVEALKFEHLFKKGRHNITLFVRDGDVGKDGKPGVLVWETFLVEGEGLPEEQKVDFFETTYGVMLLVIIVVVIIIVVLILLFMLMKKRKPKTEREKLYGEGMGLKPGEAYPVEETDSSTESYFGDELDRKGVSSFDASGQDKMGGGEPQGAMPAAEKAPELPPAKQPETQPQPQQTTAPEPTPAPEKASEKPEPAKPAPQEQENKESK